MPPPLALALTLALIAALFLTEKDEEKGYQFSPALWIPTLWLFILGSRSVTEWVALGGPASSSGGGAEEGSPIDRAFFFVLMILGMAVLSQRTILWGQLFESNVWLMAFFLYCGLSILWSDFPFVAAKRWIKALGDPIMMLIILTDPRPIKAFEMLVKRCAYIILPLSVTFIKYFPNLGRSYSEWTGGAAYNGVATNKNTLGCVCMFCGLFFLWKLAEELSKKKESRSRRDLLVYIGGLSMVGWLFELADSKTSLGCLLLGILVYLVLGVRTLRSHVGIFVTVAVSVFFILEWTVNIRELLITSSGRDATLTGRTELWAVLWPMGDENPWLGIGFESFWLGSRLDYLSSLWYWKPTQAHNGYLEAYLNIGMVGLFFLGILILASFWHIRSILVQERAKVEVVNFARFGLAFLIIYLVYNSTEAAFKSLHFLFVIFLIVGTKYIQPQLLASRPKVGPVGNYSGPGGSFRGIGQVSSKS